MRCFREQHISRPMSFGAPNPRRRICFESFGLHCSLPSPLCSPSSPTHMPACKFLASHDSQRLSPHRRGKAFPLTAPTQALALCLRCHTPWPLNRRVGLKASELGTECRWQPSHPASGVGGMPVRAASASPLGRASGQACPNTNHAAHTTL